MVVYVPSKTIYKKRQCLPWDHLYFALTWTNRKFSISLHGSLKQGFREINVKMMESGRSWRITYEFEHIVHGKVSRGDYSTWFLASIISHLKGLLNGVFPRDYNLLATEFQISLVSFALPTSFYLVRQRPRPPEDKSIFRSTNENSIIDNFVNTHALNESNWNGLCVFVHVLRWKSRHSESLESFWHFQVA